MYSASSLASQQTRLPMSAGWPTRPKGSSRSSISRASRRAATAPQSRVSVIPGAMLFTVMPNGARSSAQQRVIMRTAALLPL